MAGRRGRKTKIVCTIGPATSSEKALRALIQAGMNVARLNFSHGTHAEHGEVIARIRRLAAKFEVPIAILQDVAGPKVRVGSFAQGTVELVPGDSFTLTAHPVEGSQERVSVSYPGLPDEVSAGDTLLLADGAIELRVREIADRDIHCEVVFGGTLSARKGVNCPSGLFGLPILGDKDLHDLEFGVQQGVDYVALSFVRTADDVQTARRAVARFGGDVPIIAKIETQASLGHIDAILAEADGIMIARGDLSIETPFARVPTLQKKLIAEAGRHAKPVITATQMLFSMVHAPRPTRAEVADVANAILDGSDAVMLSEETTVGKYPTRAVRTLAAIALETEQSASWTRLGVREGGPAVVGKPSASEAEAFALAACQLAARLAVQVIGALTSDGYTARCVAKFRPSQPILAATTKPATYRRLALVSGVVPLLLPGGAPTREEMVQQAIEVARGRGWKDLQGVFLSATAIVRAGL